MSNISSVSPPVVIPQPQQAQPPKRPADGDSPAVEAAESNATKRAEKQNNGFAPHVGANINVKV